MDDRRFSIIIAAAGCLPDSEDYPYMVEGLLDAEAALKSELDRVFGDDDAAQTDAIETEALAELREYEATTVDLGGSYSLAIELKAKPTGKKLFDVPESWRKEWPCSRLAGKTVAATFADNGDLVALRVSRDDIEFDTADLEAAELEAAVETFA